MALEFGLTGSMVQPVNNHSFVGAGSLMPMQRYLDQQAPLNDRIHSCLRHSNPPILENIHYLPVKTFRNSKHVMDGNVHQQLFSEGT
jgi:hypothetical protein